MTETNSSNDSSNNASNNMSHKPNISKANACPPLPDNASTLDKAIYWVGIGLGSGLPKKAPGTWGTLGGMIVGIPLMMLGFLPFLLITLIASIGGIWICDRTSKLMGVHDDPHIVWDEWAGIWIAMLPMAAFYQGSILGCMESCESSLMATQQTLLIMGIVIFALFRFFDIIKPFPISYIDKKLEGGLGIMLDDILAGLAVLILFVGYAVVSN